jgi:hypothetical protein
VACAAAAAPDVDPTGDSPGAHCVPHGMPLALFPGGGHPVGFVQRPEMSTLALTPRRGIQ